MCIRDRIKMVIEPDKKEYIGDGTVEYSLKLSTASSDNMAIYFISRHQEIEVYANDNLIYYVKHISRDMVQQQELIIRLLTYHHIQPM